MFHVLVNHQTWSCIFLLEVIQETQNTQASIPRHVWLSVGPLEQALRLQYARTSLWGSWVPALRSKLRRGWTMGAELVKKH